MQNDPNSAFTIVSTEILLSAHWMKNTTFGNAIKDLE